MSVEDAAVGFAQIRQVQGQSAALRSAAAQAASVRSASSAKRRLGPRLPPLGAIQAGFQSHHGVHEHMRVYQDGVQHT